MMASKTRIGIGNGFGNGNGTMRLCRSQLIRAGSRCDFSTMLQSQQPLISSSVSKQYVLRQLEMNPSLRASMAYSLAFAEDEQAFDMLQHEKHQEQENQQYSIKKENRNAQRMEEQLKISHHQLRWKEQQKPIQRLDYAPLPRTFRDVRSHTSRAIVVTECNMPFSIVEVNQAWEGLCGYGYQESRGKSLGPFLQGPETDLSSVTAMMSQLLRGEEAGTVITNYTKEGRRFRNRLRVGPLVNDNGDTTHFVGVLQEISDGL